MNNRISGKLPNIWKQSSTFISNSWVREEIKREIRKYFDVVENKHTIPQHWWDATNAVLRKTFMALNEHSRRKASDFSDLRFYLKKLEKEEKQNLK